MTSRSDLDRFGFDKNEIRALLAAQGIHIGADSEVGAPKPTKPFPEWKQTMSLHPALTEKDVGHAVAGIDPYQPGYLSEDECAEVSRWTDLVVAAIDAGHLAAVKQRADPDGSSHWAIKPADLAAWCSLTPISFPLPSSILIPSTDVGLRDALVASQEDCLRWKLRAESLERSAEKIKSLQSEIDNLRNAHREQQETITKITRERDNQKHESTEVGDVPAVHRSQNKTALTKRTDTLLTVIVALCKEAKIDPQKPGTASLLAKLTEDIGAPVNEGTIKPLLDTIPSALAKRTK